MTEWSAMVDKVMNLKNKLRFPLLVSMWVTNAYVSVVRSLKTSGYANDAEVKISGSMPMM